MWASVWRLSGKSQTRIYTAWIRLIFDALFHLEILLYCHWMDPDRTNFRGKDCKRLTTVLLFLIVIIIIRYLYFYIKLFDDSAYVILKGWFIRFVGFLDHISFIEKILFGIGILSGWFVGIKVQKIRWQKIELLESGTHHNVKSILFRVAFLRSPFLQLRLYNIFRVFTFLYTKCI